MVYFELTPKPAALEALSQSLDKTLLDLQVQAHDKVQRVRPAKILGVTGLPCAGFLRTADGAARPAGSAL